MSGSSNASGEKIVEGAEELHKHAAAGNINAKMEALAGAAGGATRFAATMEMLGRTMSEPDTRYGPEITEPIVKAGAQLHAAAIQISEGRANLESLANMNLRDLAGSSRQAPHHSELSENGSR